MLKKIGKTLFLGFIIFSFGRICFAAQDIVFEVTVDKTVAALGDRIQLSLAFQGATDVPAPQIQEPEGFSARYLGPSTMMSIVNGRMSSSISHIYVLIPLKAGKFTLGPFSADYNGQKYMSKTIDVEVTDRPIQQKPARSAALPYAQAEGSAEEQLKDRIFVELDAAKRDVYLNEIIPVTVRLYVNRLAIRDIEYPVIAADGFSKEQFEPPKQYQKALAGLAYDTIEFRTSAYPVKPGTLVLGPAEIKCNVVVRRPPSGGRQSQRQRTGSPFDDFFGDDNFFNDFFTRFETYPLDLKSTELAINVKPLPEENKPQGFTGAVGEFDMQAEADSVNVKVGDPITLKMKITGAGNFATVNAPVLEETKDFKVYQPQSKMEGADKIFEQVIIPLSENATRIPVVSFSFFDPEAQVYQTVKRGPIAIVVSKPEAAEQLLKPKLVEMPGTTGLAASVLPEKEEILGKDIIYIKDNPGALKKRSKFLYQSPLLIWFLLLVPAAFLVLFFWEKRNQRLRTDIRYARMQVAYKKARKGLRKAEDYLRAEKQEEFYTTVFKALQEYIGDRLHVASGGITALSAQQYLRPKAVSEEVLAKIKHVFESADAVRFAPASVAKDQMPEILRLATEIVEELEKVKL